MTEGYIIVKRLDNGEMKVLASKHLKKDITREWRQIKFLNANTIMVLLKCTRLDSFNVTSEE